MCHRFLVQMSFLIEFALVNSPKCSKISLKVHYLSYSVPMSKDQIFGERNFKPNPPPLRKQNDIP